MARPYVEMGGVFRCLFWYVFRASLAPLFNILEQGLVDLAGLESAASDPVSVSFLAPPYRSRDLLTASGRGKHHEGPER